jgi:ABC-2 type transport system ATP-binding protein
VEGLGKRYGSTWATRNVSFDVRRGEIFGIIGPNGAGKTTTLKVLAGLLAPTEGRAHAGDLSVDDPRHKARIGYLPEESPLYEDMSAKQYLRFFARLYDVPRAVADARIDETLGHLQLDAKDEKKIGDMSKGMRRKVAIARSLVNDPDLILFDEPASGLDPVVSAYILDLVRMLAHQGKTIIFSAHNLYHMERICDRVLILRKGEMVALGSMKEIRELVHGTEYVASVSVPLRDATPGEKGFERVLPDLDAVRAFEREAQGVGGRLIEVRTREMSLEEIFLRTTKPDAPAPSALPPAPIVAKKA